MADAIKEVPRLLSDGLSELFVSQKQEILNHFSEDIKFLISSGNLRELDDGEIETILSFLGDLIDSIYTMVIRRTSSDIHNYLRWTPELGDSGENLIKSCELFYKELLEEIAKAKAERDIYKERAESMESLDVIVTGKYKILELLERENRPLKPVEIASKLNLSEVTVRKYIKELVEEGLIIKDNKTRPYTYYLGDPNWRARLRIKERSL
ncbi:MAG: winged helix-turn-helix transcriptional regulator [Candidatus Korarchaeum sp.]|nr:winged helix-turn-helix transcriptional regulator [Candidatus Korarchaeum sp.]